MQIRHLLIRIVRYYKNNGLLSSLSRIILHSRRFILQNKYIIFYAELTDLPDTKPQTPPNFIIKCCENENDISEEDREIMGAFINQEIFLHILKVRFGKGAYIWLIKEGGKLKGFIWSIVEIPIQPYFFPLTGRDVHLFDNVMLPVYRGKGMNPVLINNVLFELRSMGFFRAFIETRTWNTSEIKSLEKTFFCRFAEAKKINFRDLTLSLWSKKQQVP